MGTTARRRARQQRSGPTGLTDEPADGEATGDVLRPDRTEAPATRRRRRAEGQLVSLRYGDPPRTTDDDAAPRAARAVDDRVGTGAAPDLERSDGLAGTRGRYTLNDVVDVMT